MSTREKVIFCWSGGKDSALALNRIRRDDRYEVAALITTCNEHFQRVSMHGVRIELLEQQARAIGLPLQKILVSQQGTNEEYQQKMAECLLASKAAGITACVFGDIFLADLRRWREDNLAAVGLRGIFPIWQIDTRELINEFIAQQFRSVICCVNDAWLGEGFVGREIDTAFVADLPADVDPCGENGEFHSFCFAGPIFREPVSITVGEKVYRPLEQMQPATTAPSTSTVCPLPGARETKGFWFCDLLPAGQKSA
jgi:uncharacterized protein (TIGR00290 family)